MEMDLSQANKRTLNNFDFIRLIAALLVIITHSYTLKGSKDVDFLSKLTSGSIQFSHLGVATFFIISGYLITQSFISSNTWKSYLWKRILRLIPGLTIVLILCAFLLGPILTVLTLNDYFLSNETYKFLLSDLIYFKNYSLPGVFTDNPIKGVNGSLWTLSYEFTLYILVMVGGFLGLLKKRYILLLLWLIFFIVRIILGDRFFWFNYASPFTLNLNVLFFFEWSFYFLSGMLFFLFKDKRILDWKVLVVLFIFYTVFAVMKNSEVLNIMNYFFVPYLVMFLSSIPGKLNNVSKLGDFSYGLYIYAFPIQQLLIFGSNNNISILNLIIFSILCTLIFAAGSWYLVEKRALKFKNLIH
jgi:peptidoglycan/LPS O-acetylase OafA/YrhL